MKDELELLKRDWQKKGNDFPRLSHDEIYRMLWKRSSSIVKWILIISILEFTLPHLLYFLPMASDGMEIYEKLGVKNLSIALGVLGYAAFFYFIYLFYKRYKEISVLDNAKELMGKIMKTRRTVKHYIIYGLSYLVVTCFILMVGIYLSDNLMAVFPEKNSGNVTPERFKNIILWTMAILSVLLVLLMGGIYFLLYGLLLRKLKKNYKELKRLEV